MLSRNIMVLAALMAVLFNAGVQGELTLIGCVDAYVYLTCPADETLEVADVRVVTEKPGVTGCGGQGSAVPQIPKGGEKLCANRQDCMYRPDICRNKRECLFFLSGESFRGDKNEAMQITYGCKAGTSRVAGISAVILVTFLLVLGMAAVVFILWNRHAQTGEEYVEFENRLSRTSSMSSEINARFSKKGKKESVEVTVSPDEVKVPPKVLDEKTASVI